LLSCFTGLDGDRDRVGLCSGVKLGELICGVTLTCFPSIERIWVRTNRAIHRLLHAGVSVDTLLESVNLEEQSAIRYLIAFCDGGYTTNLPLADVRGGKAWVVDEYDGRALAPEHGGPARLLVSHLYFGKARKGCAASNSSEKTRFLVSIEVVEILVAGSNRRPWGYETALVTIGNTCANYVLATLLTFFADRGRLGMHLLRSRTTYFHSKPTQISPHPSTQKMGQGSRYHDLTSRARSNRIITGRESPFLLNTSQVISRLSHDRAKRHSRSTVEGEVPKIFATSSTVNPPK
jgi:Oxidoreductase molybdopterin binding domain